MPYEYIKDTYGVSVKKGDNIKFEDGRLGVVIAAKGAGGGNYVRVKFDGDTRISNCHPCSIKVL
jgi:signal peptidase I